MTTVCRSSENRRLARCLLFHESTRHYTVILIVDKDVVMGFNRNACLAAAVLRLLPSMLAMVVGCAATATQAGSVPVQPFLPSSPTAALDQHSSTQALAPQTRPGARFEPPVDDEQDDASEDDGALVVRTDINSASAAELAAALPGIGPSKAQAIVEWRETHGPFQSVEQLLEVSGIGPATLQNIRPYIHLGSGRQSSLMQYRQPLAERKLIAAVARVLARAEQDRRRALTTGEASR